MPGRAAVGRTGDRQPGEELPVDGVEGEVVPGGVEVVTSLDRRVGTGGEGRLVAVVEDAERRPEHRHRGAKRLAAIGRLGDHDIQVEVEQVQGKRRVVHVARTGACQPRVPEVHELRRIGDRAAVGEAGAPVRRVGVARQVATAGEGQPGLLAVVVADRDMRSGHRDRGLALRGLVGLVGVQRRVIDPDVAERGLRLSPAAGGGPGLTPHRYSGRGQPGREVLTAGRLHAQGSLGRCRHHLRRLGFQYALRGLLPGERLSGRAGTDAQRAGERARQRDRGHSHDSDGQNGNRRADAAPAPGPTSHLQLPQPRHGVLLLLVRQQPFIG